MTADGRELLSSILQAAGRLQERDDLDKHIDELKEIDGAIWELVEYIEERE
jgi:hypothetical protein